MSEHTTQVEGLDFTVKDHSSEPAERMAHAFERVHHAAEHSMHTMERWGHHSAMAGLGALGIGWGFHAMGDRIKEVNEELEESAQKIAGVQYTFGGWQKGTTAQQKWNESLEHGEEIVKDLEASERKLKMGRMELADVYKSAYAIGQRHNLNQEELMELTEKLGAAQRVLGVNADFAGMQITRMVMSGKVRGFDDFSKQMRFAIGDMKHFAALSEARRFEKVKTAMGDLLPAAIGMGKTLHGAFFDMRQSIEEATRDLSKPVFEEVTKTVGEWAAKLNEVRENGKSVSAIYGDRLVSAFHFLKDATVFIADHWQAIAAVLVSSKMGAWMEALSGAKHGAAAAGGAAGGLGGAVGAMTIKAGVVNLSSGPASALSEMTASQIRSKLQPGLDHTMSKLFGMAGKTMMVTEALGVFYVGLQGVAKVIDELQTKSIATQAAAPRTLDALTSGAKAMSSAMHERSVKETFSHLQSAFSAYGLKPGQMLSAKTIADELRTLEPGLAAKQIGMYGIRGASAKSVQGSGFIDEAAGRIAGLLNNFASQMLAAYPELAKSESHTAKKADHIVNIEHQYITPEFRDPNPDRLFHRIVNEAVQMANSPLGSNARRVPG